MPPISHQPSAQLKAAELTVFVLVRQLEYSLTNVFCLFCHTQVILVLDFVDNLRRSTFKQRSKVPPSPPNRLTGNGEVGTLAYLDDVAHFLFVQTAVSIAVVNFKRPSEFVLQVSTENQMNCCHILQEVYLAVLEGSRA